MSSSCCKVALAAVHASFFCEACRCTLFCEVAFVCVPLQAFVRGGVRVRAAQVHASFCARWCSCACRSSACKRRPCGAVLLRARSRAASQRVAERVPCCGTAKAQCNLLCTCVFQRRHGISTGLASSVSSSRTGGVCKATPEYCGNGACSNDQPAVRPGSFADICRLRSCIAANCKKTLALPGLSLYTCLASSATRKGLRCNTQRLAKTDLKCQRGTQNSCISRTTPQPSAPLAEA